MSEESYMTTDVKFCKKTKVPMLWVVDNMSKVFCPHCSVSVILLYMHFEGNTWVGVVGGAWALY